MISVCVAAFNGEKYIEEQILSVLRNLDSQDEIIISDDDVLNIPSPIKSIKL